MADKNVTYTDTQDDTVHDSATGISSHPGTEPATAHDTTEGGVMGAVGGAIVGALAGGPIGAIIGAVAGGAASAAAVNVVDKHDHDYDRTVGSTAATGTTTDYSQTTTPVGTASTGTTTAASDPYATTTAASDSYATSTAGTGYNSSFSQNTGAAGTSGEAVIPIVEEELEVGKREVQSGGAHIRTGVVETPVEQTVNLREEHVTVSRHAANEPVTDSTTAFKEQNFEVTETDEVPVVAKTARVVEEVVVGKTATERTETVHDTVRRTDVEVEDLTDGGTTRR